MSIDLSLYPVVVLVMDPEEPLVGTVATLCVVAPVRGFPARTKIDRVALEVPVPQSIVGGASGKRIALLAFAQRVQSGYKRTVVNFQPISQPVQLSHAGSKRIQGGSQFFGAVRRQFLLLRICLHP